jgi:glycerol transport system ATP-binding protein
MSAAFAERTESVTLIVEDVSKKVGAETHIRDVSLTLQPGSLNVLLGATLAGKTSLMRLMAGLDAPTSGRIVVDGKDVTGQPVQRRSVAMVYQQFINYPSLSVYENIASPLRVAGLPKSEIETRVAHAAKLLKLAPYLDRKPLNLSGGQQQRTAIARALVKRASLVLLDEPLANLDYKLREELREELPKVFAESGAIFVYATTEPSEALLLGGNTATLYQGAVTQFGPTPQVYRRPHDITTARVFSDPPLNTLTARKAGGTIALSTGGEVRATGTFAAVPDGEYTVGFRAHHLALEPTEAGALTISATVSVSEITGSESFIHLDAGDRRFVALVPGVKRLEPGSSVMAYLAPRQIFLFDETGRLMAADFAQAA